MIRTATRSLAALLLLAGAAAGQFTPVGGGCPGETPTPVIGTPQLNGYIAISHGTGCNSGPVTHNGIIALGLQLLPQPINFPKCAQPTFCSMVVLPFYVHVTPSTASLGLPIPNNPILQGQTVYVQSTCHLIYSLPGCFTRMHQAVKFTIT